MDDRNYVLSVKLIGVMHKEMIKVSAVKAHIKYRPTVNLEVQNDSYLRN